MRPLSCMGLLLAWASRGSHEEGVPGGFPRAAPDLHPWFCFIVSPATATQAQEACSRGQGLPCKSPLQQKALKPAWPGLSCVLVSLEPGRRGILPRLGCPWGASSGLTCLAGKPRPGRGQDPACCPSTFCLCLVSIVVSRAAAGVWFGSSAGETEARSELRQAPGSSGLLLVEPGQQLGDIEGVPAESGIWDGLGWEVGVGVVSPFHPLHL